MKQKMKIKKNRGEYRRTNIIGKSSPKVFFYDTTDEYNQVIQTKQS